MATEAALEFHHVEIWLNNLGYEVSVALERGKNALYFVC
jgi:hypothetical protein